MRIRLIIGLLILGAIMASCQSGTPPTMFVMEVTRIVTVIVTATSEDDMSTGLTVTPGAIIVQPDTQTDTATPSPQPSATRTLMPSQSPTPNVFPTPSIGQIYVAEQAFERGWMYWIEPIQQIWVQTASADGQPVWSVYNDTFEEGMPETDPTLDELAPEGTQQPIRGFGKLWRENPEIQERLGWALDDEVGYVTRYEYHPGGRVSEENQYIPAPGYHIIETLDQRRVKFDEATRSWETLANP